VLYAKTRKASGTTDAGVALA